MMNQIHKNGARSYNISSKIVQTPVKAHGLSTKIKICKKKKKTKFRSEEQDQQELGQMEQKNRKRP